MCLMFSRKNTKRIMLFSSWLCLRKFHFHLHEWFRRIGLFDIVVKINFACTLEAQFSFLHFRDFLSVCLKKIFVWKSYLLHLLIKILFWLLKWHFLVCFLKKRKGLFLILIRSHRSQRSAFAYRFNLHYWRPPHKHSPNHSDKSNGRFRLKLYRKLSDRLVMCSGVVKHSSCH